MEGLTVLDIANSTCTEETFVSSEVAALFEEVKNNRRWFHANPELSFQEFGTGKHIVELLRGIGISEIYEQCADTGVVAMIWGEAGPGPCIALRADIDALPVQETSDVEYRSKNEGTMHACGHDGHITGLVTAAKVLFNQRSTLKGSVKLLFQPAEEGFGGAKRMVEAGCMEEGKFGPRVDEVYGLHLWSYANLGDIQCSLGPVMAACDKFTINVKGQGGHGAAPQGTVDAIVEAAAVVTSLQTIIPRNMDPLETGVITCGMINGGHGFNIIADQVQIVGTTRSFTRDAQQLIKQRMGCICCGVAQTYGGEIEMKYEENFPPTINAYPEHYKYLVKAASRFVGEKRSCLTQKTMIAEDFPYFLQERPGCFFFVGAALPGPVRPHHQAVFDFDERALLISASILAQVAKDRLMA